MSCFDYEVELSERRGSSLGGPRPRAKLRIYTSTSSKQSSTSAESEILSIPLAVGKALDEAFDEGLKPASRAELLYELKRFSERCARERIARLINRRDYSSAEIAQKLREDGYVPELIEHVVKHAEESYLIDNTRFAESYIRSKLRSGWGSSRIERELKLKGIDTHELEGWPEAYLEGQSEDERAYKLLVTRRRPTTNAYPKLMRYLVSRGFSSTAASSAVRRLMAEWEDARTDLS